MNDYWSDFQYEFNPNGNVFELGFTFVDERQKSIIDINTNSNAYMAGLRKGDSIGGRSYNPGDPDHEATFKVFKNNKRITITYLPSKTALIPSLLNDSNNKKRISSLD